MLKFFDGFRSVLLMSAAGAVSDQHAGGGGGDAAAAATAATAAASPPAGAATDPNKAWSFPTEKAFAEYLPEKYRTDPSLRDIKNFDGLVSSYVNAQKMLGADKATIVQLPTGDDPKAYDDFYNKLGRPESPDKYQVPKRADGKDYSDGDKALQKAILPVLHKAGLNQRQIDAIVPAWNEITANATAAAAKQEQDAIAAGEAELTKEWGAAKDAKIALGRDALTHLSTELKLGDALTKALEAKDANGNALGNNPALAKLFAHIGGQLQEDGLIGKGGGGGQAEYSPAEAMQQIKAKEGDADFNKAYRDKKHPGHADAVAEMARLYAQAYPAEK